VTAGSGVPDHQRHADAAMGDQGPGPIRRGLPPRGLRVGQQLKMYPLPRGLYWQSHPDRDHPHRADGRLAGHRPRCQQRPRRHTGPAIGPFRGDAPGSQRGIEIVHHRGRKVVTDGTGSGQRAGNQPGHLPGRQITAQACGHRGGRGQLRPARRTPTIARTRPLHAPRPPSCAGQSRAKFGVSQQRQQDLGRPALHTVMVPRPRPDSGIPLPPGSSE